MQTIGSICLHYGYLDKSKSPYWLFAMSQPFLNIRLPTYLLAHKWAGKNLKSLGYSSFARHYFRNRCLLSLPQGTKMFQFPWFPLHILYIQIRVIWHYSDRVSPFGYLRFKACLAAPRSFSQPTTSFIGILCQGILCVRLSNFLRLKCNWLVIGNYQNLPFALSNDYIRSITYITVSKIWTKLLSYKTQGGPLNTAVLSLILEFTLEALSVDTDNLVPKLKQSNNISINNRGGQPYLAVKIATNCYL